MATLLSVSLLWHPKVTRLVDIACYIICSKYKFSSGSSLIFIGFIVLQGPEQNALGNLLVLCLLCGLFAGVALDWLWLIGKGGF